MVQFFRKEDRASLISLLQWLFIAALSGIIGNFCVQGFYFLYIRMTGFLSSIDSVPLWLWPVAGALPAGLLVYSKVPGAMGEGIPSYLESVRNRNGYLSLRETLFKFFAALLTLGTFGNGGFLGPVGRISAGLLAGAGRFLTRRILSPSIMQIFPICGMAATVGALIHSPIGGGIFAVEIILKTNMRYRQLFPAILASTSSVFVAKSMGFPPILVFHTAHDVMDVKIVPIILLTTLAAGLLGKAFILLYSLVSRLFQRDHAVSGGKRTLYLLAGSFGASMLVLINPFLAGTSRSLFTALMKGMPELLYGPVPRAVPLFVLLLVLLVVKGSANILTVGSGMSAGFTGPAIIMGLLLGAAFADIFHISFGSVEYYALMAAGFAGYFAGIMNTPVAAAIITIEMFGLYYSLPAGLAAVVGFLVNQQHTLYDLVLDEREDERFEEWSD